MVDYKNNNVVVNGMDANIGGLVLCMHKHGSVLINRVVRRACELLNLRLKNAPSVLFTANVPDDDWIANTDNLLQIIDIAAVNQGFREPTGQLLDICQKLSLNVLCMVRDPRDAMVSQFFSFTKSHSFPRALSPEQVNAAEKSRRKFIDNGIDSYVLRYGKWRVANLNRIVDRTRSGQLEPFRYEDAIFNKPILCTYVTGFLSKCFHGINIPSTIEFNEELLLAAGSIPVKENQNVHIRKAIPGDHKEKLEPRTIDSLNDMYSTFLNYFYADLV